MSLIGKILIFVAGFGLGMAFAFYKADPTIINEGDSIEMEYNGKVKKGGNVDMSISDIEQGHRQDSTKKKRKWFK